MKKLCFTLVGLMALSTIVLSQKTQKYYLGSGQSSLFLQSYETPDSEKFNAKYLSEEWSIGLLQTVTNSILNDVAFKYNITEDKFEMRADVNPKIVDRINFDGRIFIYTTFINQFGSVAGGYFELQSEGYARLLLRYAVRTKEAKKGAFGYEAYQNVTKSQYLKIGNKPAKQLLNKKEGILEALSDRKEEIDRYVKDEKLNLNKTKDIIGLLHYYSGLYAESVDKESSPEEEELQN